jgi:hypothetical protein
MFTLTNSYGSAVLAVGGGGGLSISTALATNGGTLTVTSSGGNPVQFITAGSNIARLGNGSAAIQLLLGTSTDTADAQLSVYSQSTTRPGLKLNMPSGTSATQEAFGVYNNGTLTTRIDTDGDITSSKAGWEIIGATGSSVTVGAFNGVTYLGSTAAFGGSMVVSDSRVAVKNTIPIGWSSDTTSYGTVDVALYRDAANTLAQRNSTNAQTFRVYNTYTDASNYTRLDIASDGSTFYLGTYNNGTGTARSLALVTASGVRWNINTSGHLLAGTDNTYDIGASGTTRPRNIYVANGGTFGTFVSLGASGSYGWATRSWMSSPSDGVIGLYNQALTDFSRLQFGGTSASFPAIKRSSAELQVVLADDTGFAATQSLYIRYGSGTPEGAVTAPVGAIYSRTDGGAGTSFYVKESGSGNTGWVAK